jgi:hypothetical protein
VGRYEELPEPAHLALYCYGYGSFLNCPFPPPVNVGAAPFDALLRTSCPISGVAMILLAPW